MDALETRALTKLYGSTRAVDALDMHVPRGSIYGFVGKNGSGKSTTMKLASGLVTPTSGEVLLFGRRRTPDIPIGTLIEMPGIIGGLSALDNLMTKATALGVVRAKAQCQGLLALVGLTEVAKRHVKGFSLGMKQRLGIALALIGAPDLLLLDEPLNGLDPEAAYELRTMMQEFVARGGAIFLSSHVLDTVELARHRPAQSRCRPLRRHQPGPHRERVHRCGDARSLRRFHSPPHDQPPEDRGRTRTGAPQRAPLAWGHRCDLAHGHVIRWAAYHRGGGAHPARQRSHPP